jgi:hypothetical protein
VTSLFAPVLAQKEKRTRKKSKEDNKTRTGSTHNFSVTDTVTVTTMYRNVRLRSDSVRYAETLVTPVNSTPEVDVNVVFSFVVSPRFLRWQHL